MGEHSRAGRRLAEDPIAIVGMSSLFPMARDHRDYWQNIVDGADCTSEVPEDRWRLDDYYDPDPTVPDKTYSRRGGFIPDVEFNPMEFAIPPNQLDVTSTCQTLSLGVARDLLRNAGATGSSWYDPVRTGVVLGVTGPVPLMHPLAARLSTPVLKEVVRAAGLTESDATEIAERYVRAFAPWEENSFPGLLANVVAGRVANRLDLGGLNSTVDAACAASLSALRMAVAELTDRRADTMIAGGVDTENSIFGFMCFSAVGALSRSNRISPLSDAADGTLVGEGIGMIALRRLADAERDGNRVYAVIRGLGSSSDGRAKSIYAPRAAGQRIALDRAYEDAGCSPASVELFEAHATGTAVGDRTELTALNELLTEHAAEPRSAAVGSIKSQIGHTKGAAGTASLIKLALSLYHKTLPPTINVERPSGSLDPDSAPLYVNVATRPWIRDPHRPARRAAASAMGFGGTNFHVVLEEHSRDRSAVRNLHRTARAHLWHAPDPAALLELLSSGAPAADGGPVPAGHARVGFVAADDDGAAQLRALAAERVAADPEAESWSLPRGVFYRRRAAGGLRVGVLFAGQGSQYLNMGLEAALNVPPVGAAFDEANEVFAGQDDRLGQVVYPPPVFDPELRQAQEATLRLTQYAQPAIGALSAGQFRFLRELGLKCVSFAGHSFGELTALWAAGSLTDGDYFRLAAARGAAMAARDSGADPGAMAAVAADRERVTQILAETGTDVVVCNHNAPDQVVVGGGTAAVDAVLSACAEAGITARKLPVSAAFHTPYVAHAVDEFRAAAQAARIGEPAAAVHANSPGASYGPDQARNAETLTAQLLQPVEFVEAVRAMQADGVTVFVECGPKQVLTGLVRRILGDEATAIATDAGPLGDADVALKQAAVRLAVLGAPVTGINRYDEPAPASPGSASAGSASTGSASTAPSGLAVTLSAAEYVPPARAAAYRAGLADGFRVTLPVPAPAPGPADVEPGQSAAPVPVPVPGFSANGNGSHSPGPAEVHHPEVHYAEERFSMTAHPSTVPQAGDDPAAQHLALHSRYLESQLQVAEALLGLVSEHGLDHPQLPGIAESIKDQSIAIGSAHARAAEVLARLTELELGTGSAPAPAGYAPAQFPVAPAQPAPRELPGQRYAIDAVPPLAPAARPAANGAPAPAPAAPGLTEPQPAVSQPPVFQPPVFQPPVSQPPVSQPAVSQPAGSPAGVDTAALRAALIAIVAEKTGYPPDMVDPSMDLESELGVDSIKRVQVIGAVQDQFAGLPTVGPEQLSELRTLDMVVDFMADGAGDVDPKAPRPAAERGPADDAPPVPRLPVGLIDLPAIDRIGAPYPEERVAVVVHRGGADAAAVASALAGHGWTVRETGGPADAGESFAAALDGPVHAVVLLLTDGQEPSWADATGRLAEVVLVAKHAQPPLTAATAATAAGPHRAAFVAVTRLDGRLGRAGTAAEATALLGGAAGVVKTLAIEAPGLFCRALDLDPGLGPEAGAAAVLDELHDAAVDTVEVGVDAAGARRTITPSRYHCDRQAGPPTDADLTDLTDLTVRADDVFVVTGGARGVTALCVAELAARQPAEFILLGRTELADEPRWAADVPDDGLKAAVIAAVVTEAARAAGPRPAPREIERQYADIAAKREIQATLADLAGKGATARYLAVDVTDADAVRAALDGAGVTGVIHGAGVLADAFLADKTAEQVARVLGPKLGGLSAVLAAVRADQLRHLVLFTSVAGLLGNAGQADYAAANEALGRFAASWKHRHPDQHVVAIDWGAWDAGMVTPSLRAALSARGVPLLDPAAGARAFAGQFAAARAGQTRVLIGANTALSAPAPSGRGTITARRELAGIETDEVITAHRIGAHPVLPASFGLGWLINTAERAYPGTKVVRARDFQVFRGIVFDGSSSHGGEAGEYWAELAPASESGGRLTVRAAVRGTGPGGRPVPHYGATLELAASPSSPTPGSVPTMGAGAGDAFDLIYASAVLFHAPRLQGIREVLEYTDRRLALRCRLADAAAARGAFAGALHSPVLTDILLQGAAVLGGRSQGPSLPLTVTTADYYAPLPDDEDFFVVIDQPRPAGAGVSVDATATDTSGGPLVRFSGAMLVPTPDMAAKFAEAVTHWRTQLELA